jgi:hypothetical protein
MSSECLCVEGGGITPPPPASSVTIYAKTTVYCSPDSSMLGSYDLHELSFQTLMCVLCRMLKTWSPLSLPEGDTVLILGNVGNSSFFRQ